MKIFVLGSRACHPYFDIGRKPKDYDVLGSYDDVVKFVHYIFGSEPFNFYPISKGNKYLARNKNFIIEAEIAWPGSLNEKLFNLIDADPDTIPGYDECLIPSLDVLYMLKMSHRYLKNSPHFRKTMNDIHLMRKHGAKIREEHMEFFKEREKYTYSYAHPKLNKDKSEFFSNDGLVYVYDHDSIHESMKIMEQPAYTYFKDDQKEVWCSKEKFFSCAEEIRLNAVLEESLVLALERSQIPFPGIDKHRSFRTALEKVCTSITSGWFREYAWENYDDVMERFYELRTTYVDKFWEDVELGIVKKL